MGKHYDFTKFAKDEEVWGVWATGGIRGATWAKKDGEIFNGTKEEAEAQARLWNSRLSGLSRVGYTARRWDY